VADFEWEQSGPISRTSWGERSWTLNVDESEPGLLSASGRRHARLLALDHIATAGRRTDAAFGRGARRSVRRRRSGIQVTCALAGRGGLTIRATWSRVRVPDAIDLQVQASASSVSELDRLEVGVVSQWWSRAAAPAPTVRSWIEARDSASASLTYDGREPSETLRRATTLPIVPFDARPFPPTIVATPELGPHAFYVEMVQPNDCSRRITSCTGSNPPPKDAVVSDPPCPTPHSMRYELFGYDLENGVVLRARLRGLWIRSEDPKHDALLLYEAFLREPPPLGP
jgi:hypothetical protein